MGQIAYDSKTPFIDKLAFHKGDWTAFYGDVQEEFPPKMSKPRENPVNMSVFVDANQPCWKCYDKMVMHRYYTICSECSSCLVQ